MKPIDVIRGRIDSDLIKYHHSLLCVIDSKSDIRDFRASGIVALVTPLELYDANEVDGLNKNSITARDGKIDKIPVSIVNRPSGWNEIDAHKKYYVLVFNPVQDRLSLSAGMLVPRGIPTDIKAWMDEKILKDSMARDTDGNSIIASTYEHNYSGDGVI